jgi:hypothetical protein
MRTVEITQTEMNDANARIAELAAEQMRSQTGELRDVETR